MWCKFAALLVLLIAGSGCVASKRSHPYEPRFYVVEGVALLSQAEWNGIKEKADTRAGFRFDHATRLAEDLVEVYLVSTGNERVAVAVFFELRDGKWIENKEREEDINIVGGK